MYKNRYLGFLGLKRCAGPVRPHDGCSSVHSHRHQYPSGTVRRTENAKVEQLAHSVVEERHVDTEAQQKPVRNGQQEHETVEDGQGRDEDGEWRRLNTIEAPLNGECE